MEAGREKMTLGFIIGALIMVLAIVLTWTVGGGLSGTLLVAVALMTSSAGGYAFGAESRENRINYRSYMRGYREGKRANTKIIVTDGKKGAIYPEIIKKVEEA